MNLLNVMLGKGRGGIEQAAFDYHEALSLGGASVTSVLHTQSAMCETFASTEHHTATIAPLGEWDIFAAHKLRTLAKTHNADAVICHGNRALGLALRALKGRIPVVGVAHNYKIKKRFPKADAVFCITRDLIEDCVHLDISRSRLHHIPNMTRLPEAPTRTAFRAPPVIGTMGRFVEKKGMDIFIAALGALKQKNIPFTARLGGGGALAPALKAQAEQLGISKQIDFCGWVENKQAFLRSLDLFILPSHHEPFGIVLIEAMAAGLPTITTDTEGPCEIITQHHDAVMVDKAKPYAMAEAIAELIQNPQHAITMGSHARETVTERYTPEIISQKLTQALNQVTAEPTSLL